LEISTTDILKESLGNKIDFCTFLSMFEFKDENILQFYYELDTGDYHPIPTDSNMNKYEKVKLKNKVNEVINLDEVREQFKNKIDNTNILADKRRKSNL